MSPPLNPLLSATEAFGVSGTARDFVVEADYEKRSRGNLRCGRAPDNHVSE